MEINLVKAGEKEIQKTIYTSLNWCKECYLGVAYASYPAFEILKKSFVNFLRNNGKLRVLFDIEKMITDYKLIEEFSTIPGDSECKVFLNTEKRSIETYHPKFYLFNNDKEFLAIIGSSNFTLGGLSKNIECNISIKGNTSSIKFIELKNYFNQIWNNKNSFNSLIHYEILEDYRKAYHKNLLEENHKNKKFLPIKKQLSIKTEKILNKKIRENEKFAYLLGLLVANGFIDFDKRKLEIHLYRQVFNKNKKYEGYYYVPEVSDYKISQYQAHYRDTKKIVEQIEELLNFYKSKDEIDYRYLGKKFHFLININFKTNSLIFNELNKLPFSIQHKRIKPFIPDYIYNSKNKKIIISFLKGYLDLKSRISGSDGIYYKLKGKTVYTALRIGISISHGESDFLKKMVYLFKKKLNIEKGFNASDPKKRTREYLIRIDARYIMDELIGNHWKRIFLSDFRKYLNKD